MFINDFEVYQALVDKKEKVDKIITNLITAKQIMRTNLVINGKIPKEELASSVVSDLHECSNLLRIIIQEYEEKESIKRKLNL